MFFIAAGNNKTTPPHAFAGNTPQGNAISVWGKTAQIKDYTAHTSQSVMHSPHMTEGIYNNVCVDMEILIIFN